jgi:hypothetical protein
MMAQTSVSMLWMEVSAASHKAFFALYLHTIKSGIEIRATVYERMATSQGDPTIDKSEPV